MVSIQVFLALIPRQISAFTDSCTKGSLSKVSDIALGLNTVWTSIKPKCIISKVAQCTNSVFCIQTKCMSCVSCPMPPPCHNAQAACRRVHLHPSHHCWWGCVLMQTMHKAFPLQIRSYPPLSEIFLSQWAIKIITFNHILQLLHSTEGGLGRLGPDANLFCCD